MAAGICGYGIHFISPHYRDVRGQFVCFYSESEKKRHLYGIHQRRAATSVRRIKFFTVQENVAHDFSSAEHEQNLPWSVQLNKTKILGLLDQM